MPIIPSVDSTLKHLFQLIDNYEDVFYFQRQPKAEKVRELYTTHALNHALKYGLMYDFSVPVQVEKVGYEE
ncbi:unnamed protein product [Dibothriocephalus latus]|uniref:Uncharacterized protein n=1 Tax=Dibothriocephalus latus TaxID=60516 RepID=A0A3P7LRM9_DIBLA|nr:unnamed protein product [Dibothriocephalus latus]